MCIYAHLNAIVQKKGAQLAGGFSEAMFSKIFNSIKQFTPSERLRIYKGMHV